MTVFTPTLFGPRVMGDAAFRRRSAALRVEPSAKSQAKPAAAIAKSCHYCGSSGWNPHVDYNAPCPECAL
jgi:hypothetical protein